MVCPYCQSRSVAYSDSPVVDMLRMLSGSRKRYCRMCQKKWMLRTPPQSSGMDFRSVLLIFLAVAVGFWIFCNIANIMDGTGEKIRASTSTSTSSSSAQMIHSSAKASSENSSMQSLFSANGSINTSAAKTVLSNNAITKNILSNASFMEKVKESLQRNPQTIAELKKKFKENPGLLNQLSADQKAALRNAAKQYQK